MNEPFVNVAILSENKIEFELHGDFYYEKLDKHLNGKFEAFIENNNVYLQSSETKFDCSKGLILVPSQPISESFLLKNVTIGLQFHWEQKQNQRFSGSLKILIEDNKLTVVNIVSVEQYLISVISSEMSATSSLELLKAHAVISRSWLLAQMEKRKNIKEQNYISEIVTDDEIIRWYDREDHILYDVCADDHCQRYQGITKLHAHNAEQAVLETTGSVIMFDDKICDARFSKSCGGITESFENVWENIKHPYLQKVVDYKFEPDDYKTDLSIEDSAKKWILELPKAFCNTTDEKILEQVLNNYDRKTKDFYRWKVEYSQEEIAKLINEKSRTNFGKILDLIPVKRGYSGRIIKLKIVGTEKTLVIGKELEIRKTLSTSHLYSSAFVVEKNNIENGIPQNFILRGSGWGHGVGFCQIGAAVMGEMGYRFDEILLHYFRGAEIKKIY